MNIKPLADRIIVQPMEAEEKTQGGIIIPDTTKEKPQEGKVLAVGEGKVSDNGKLQPLTVKVGDQVIYGKYSGTEIVTKEGDVVMIMREEDILGIVTK